MREPMRRTLGYLPPTVIVVTGIHLAREASAGEAFDGVVSGLWFAVLFLAGAWLATRGRADDDTRTLTASMREGLLLGIGTWLALWAFWNVPQTQALRASAGLTFLLNSSVNLAAGIVRLPWPRPSRPVASF